MKIETANICNHTFLPHLIKADSVVMDIGANHGEFSAAMIERFGCRIVAAEPVKELFDNIDRNPRLELWNVAIGGKNEWITINVFPQRCASVLAPTDTGEQAIAQPVELVTFAEFRRRGNAQHVDLLKLDIEGAELELFNSTSDANLEAVSQITIEFHEFLYPDHKEPVIKIRKRLRDLGFWDLPFSLDSTNVLFLNKKTGVKPSEIFYLRTFVRFGEGIPRIWKRLASRSKKPDFTQPV